MSAYKSWLTEYSDIYTRTPSTNALGEDVQDTWTKTYPSVQCRFFHVTYEEVKDRIGEWDNIEYRAYFLSGQAITTEDRVTYDSNDYEVVKVFIDTENYYKHAFLRRL